MDRTVQPGSGGRKLIEVVRRARAGGNLIAGGRVFQRQGAADTLAGARNPNGAAVRHRSAVRAFGPRQRVQTYSIVEPSRPSKRIFTHRPDSSYQTSFCRSPV